MHLESDFGGLSMNEWVYKAPLLWSDGGASVPSSGSNIDHAHSSFNTTQCKSSHYTLSSGFDKYTLMGIINIATLIFEL